MGYSTSDLRDLYISLLVFAMFVGIIIVIGGYVYVHNSSLANSGWVIFGAAAIFLALLFRYWKDTKKSDSITTLGKT